MRLLLLIDKKPGHFHQTEGIGRVVSRIDPATVLDRLEVRQRWLAHNAVLMHLMRRPRDPATWLRRLYGIDLAAVVKPDAVVSSGRPTIAAGILLSRHFGVPFVYSGKVTGYDPHAVTLQLVASPRYGGDVGCAWTPVPTKIEPEAYPPPRPLRTVVDLAGADLALLIGGEAHGHHYTTAEWKDLAAFVGASADRLGIRWHVSTSRRSPQFLGDLFADLEAEGRLAEFVDYRKAQAGSADRLYGCDAVVVTEDSVSMLSEAQAARRPVMALKPAAVEDSSANEAIAALAGAGGLAIMPLAGLDPERFARTLVRLAPTRAPDPRDLIAEAIAPILGLTLPERG